MHAHVPGSFSAGVNFPARLGIDRSELTVLRTLNKGYGTSAGHPCRSNSNGKPERGAISGPGHKARVSWTGNRQDDLEKAFDDEDCCEKLIYELLGNNQ